MNTLVPLSLAATHNAAFAGVLVGVLMCYAVLWLGFAGFAIPSFVCLCLGFSRAFRYQLHTLKNSRHNSVLAKCACITLATHLVVAAIQLTKMPSIYSMSYGLTALMMLADYKRLSVAGEDLNLLFQ